MVRHSYSQRDELEAEDLLPRVLDTKGRVPAWFQPHYTNINSLRLCLRVMVFIASFGTLFVFLSLFSRSHTSPLTSGNGSSMDIDFNPFDPTVRLSYGSFHGGYSSQYNITFFGRIPFAAPPVGENRFRAPQPVQLINGTYDSNQNYPACPQMTNTGSEDCLYLNVYSRPWTNQTPKRPVLLFFFGGGFIQGNSMFQLPPTEYPVLNISSEVDYIKVFSNYRVNAFGMLPGKKIKESRTSDLNPGFLDQQAALEWIRKEIHNFGGDPEDVTIWGQSAGGGSVVAQVLANGGKTQPPLFQKAITSSPFWPKTYQYDAPEAEALYDSLVNLTGCADAHDSLRCLKAVPVQSILNANQVINNANKYTTSSFTWAPVIDGTFIQEPLSVATRKGNVNGHKLFGTWCQLEGGSFTPPALNNATSDANNPFNRTDAGFDFWLRGFLPKLSERQLDEVKKLYPPLNETTEYNNVADRAGFIYRDLVLSCPDYWLAEAANTGYLGEYVIPPARHGSDTFYWNSFNPVITSDPFGYHGYAGALASFLQTGNPDKLPLGRTRNESLPINAKSGEEWVMAPGKFFLKPLGELVPRCNFWREHGMLVDA